jgi:hypothetical protein
MSRKHPVLDQLEFDRLDQGEGDLRSRKANVGATGLHRLSGASLVSVVESLTCGIEMTWPCFGCSTALGSGASLPKAKCVRDR